jgi:transposase
MPSIPDNVREAIANDLRGGSMTTHEIAEKYAVGQASVSRIAGQFGIDPGNRSATKRATEARQIDIAAEQARLAQLLIGDAFRLRDRAWEPQTVALSGKHGVEIVEIPTPAGDFRNFYTSIGIIVDKVNVLTRDDSDGMAAVDSWLRSLGVGNTQA